MDSNKSAQSNLTAAERELDRLIVLFEEGGHKTAADELAALLESHPELANRYAAHISFATDMRLLTGTLYGEKLADRAAKPPQATVEKKKSIYVLHRTPSRRKRSALRFLPLAASITLFLGLGYTFYRIGLQPAEKAAVVRVDRTQAAQWDAPIAPGRKLQMNQPVTLMKGFAEITFSRGARVILQAPCRFTPTGANALQLHRGRLVAHVPHSAAGFTVSTPRAVLTDCGTEFGVGISDKDVLTSRVFQGEVDVKPAAASASGIHPVRIFAHEGVRVDESGIIKPAGNMDGHGLTPAFFRTWEAVSQRVTVEGSIEYREHLPRSFCIGCSESSSVIQLYRERENYVLHTPIRMATVNPGTQKININNPKHKRIPAGTAVDVYLLHFDIVGMNTDVTKLTGSITFDREVLGFIYEENQIWKSARRFGTKGVAYPQDIRILGLEAADVIRLSDDRRSIHVTLGCSNGMDHIRIIVQSNPSDK
jgi:hypothetical protein